MKKLYILVVMLLMSVTAFAQNGRSLYNKYSDAPNVEAVYVSPAMFRLIGKIPDIEMQDESVNLGPIIKSLSGLYILSELLMEAKDNGEVMRLYTVGSDKIVNSLVMLARQEGETDFICIDGDMPREELENLIAEAAKD